MGDLNDFLQPPPQYPGNTESESLFKLPSFNDVMALYEYEDSIRLPAYSARPIRRYHPYLRFRRTTAPSHFDETSKYYNTVYDESYVPLEVPPLVPQNARSTNEYMLPNGIVLPPAPIIPPPPAPVAECPTLAEFEAYIDAICAQEDRHQRRLRRLLYLLPLFINSVRHALDAADLPEHAGQVAQSSTTTTDNTPSTE